MTIPLKYSMRSLLRRRISTGLTLLGITLVVIIVVCVLAMLNGLESMMVSTASPDNVIILSAGANRDSDSQISREIAAKIKVLPRIQTQPDGSLLVSEEYIRGTMMQLPTERQISPKLKFKERRPVSLRGVEAVALKVHDRVRMVEGEFFKPRAGEVIVGRTLAKNVPALTVGGSVSLLDRKWKVVGIFEADRTLFESELWGDLGQVMEASNNATAIRSITLKVVDPSGIPAFCKAVADQERLGVKALSEVQYFKEQNKLADDMKWLGYFVAIVMSVGAVFGAMNTLYASLSERIREIATMRAIGFSRSAVMTAFMIEALMMAGAAGLLGCVLASFADGYSMTLLRDFSTIVFEFRVTPFILGSGMAFALVMGLLGGLLPSWRAARLPVVQAIREL